MGSESCLSKKAEMQNQLVRESNERSQPVRSEYELNKNSAIRRSSWFL